MPRQGYIVTQGSNPGGAPTFNSDSFGRRPNATTMPDIHGDLAALYPELDAQNSQISKNVMSELKGELSPETINAIHDAAATFGVTSGMPGSQLSNYGGLRNLGLHTEQVQRQGLQDYGMATGAIHNTQTISPETQIALGEYNNAIEAAPDPAAAARAGWDAQQYGINQNRQWSLEDEARQYAQQQHDLEQAHSWAQPRTASNWYPVNSRGMKGVTPGIGGYISF